MRCQTSTGQRLLDKLDPRLTPFHSPVKCKPLTGYLGECISRLTLKRVGQEVSLGAEYLSSIHKALVLLLELLQGLNADGHKAFGKPFGINKPSSW